MTARTITKMILAHEWVDKVYVRTGFERPTAFSSELSPRIVRKLANDSTRHRRGSSPWQLSGDRPATGWVEPVPP